MKSQLFTWYNLDDSTVHEDQSNIEEPRQCMHCEKTGIQVNLGSFITVGKYDQSQGIALFACQLCGSTTIHYLELWEERFKDFYTSTKSFPTVKENLPDISKNIQTLFPKFYNIFVQSEKAQEEGLDEIAGMGYRKALEFLVTDFLLEYPVEGVRADWLKNPKTTLSNKISKIPSTKVQNLSKAISYLGNDEAHYTRKHPEHDINSIKTFIRVLVSEVQNEIEYQKAEELLNKP